MDRRLALLPILAVLAVPAAAQAAPVKISPKPAAVSPSGAATVEVANSGRSALRGTATVTAAGRTVATRSVRLPKRSVTRVTLRFGSGALQTLRGANGRATLKLALRKGAKRYNARRTLTLGLPGKPGDPAPAPGASPSPGNPQPSPAPASNRWTARLGTEGPYDDLEFTLIDGTIQITKTPLVPVYCFEMGGQYRNALSFEPFAVAGPWTLGSDGLVEQSGIAVNQLVNPGSRGISYKMTDTARTATTVTGKLGISYFDSKYDLFANKIWFVNCSGSQSFEAIPAP